MTIGIKTSNDGTLQATLGKTLEKTIRVTGKELKEPLIMSGQCKEITFAKVPSEICLYINNISSDSKLSIDGKCSIESITNVSWIQATDLTKDEDVFEIWIWK